MSKEVMQPIQINSPALSNSEDIPQLQTPSNRKERMGSSRQKNAEKVGKKKNNMAAKHLKLSKASESKIQKQEKYRKVLQKATEQGQGLQHRKKKTTISFHRRTSTKMNMVLTMIITPNQTLMICVISLVMTVTIQTVEIYQKVIPVMKNSKSNELCLNHWILDHQLQSVNSAKL